MRIVYVLTSLGMGGAERQVVALAKRMAGRGHTVALLILRPRLADQWPTAISVVHLDMYRTPFSLLSGMARGRRFLREFRPDLLHSHGFHANIVARLLRIFKPHPAVLSTVHNINEGGWLRMLAYRLTDFLACRTTAVSHAVAERFVNRKAISQQKCIVVPNGIDIDEFVPGFDRRARTRTAMGASNHFIWLSAGRVVRAKDYPNLLRAYAQVRASRPDSQLWIAGARASAAYSSSLHTLATELSLADSVRWLGLCRDMPSLLDAADAFVLASAWEGMPLAVGEAMAMEKPVVATDVGGVSELVGDAGVIVPPNAPDALAQAMLQLMQSTADSRRALGRSARVRISTHVSMDVIADQWDALYWEILESKV